jgi:hypothetical protein
MYAGSCRITIPHRFGKRIRALRETRSLLESLPPHDQLYEVEQIVDATRHRTVVNPRFPEPP